METPAYGTTVLFTRTWEIGWKQFRDLSTKKVQKFFNTTFNGVAYFWSIEIGVYSSSAADKFGLFVRYLDGPTPFLERVNYRITFFNFDNPESKRPIWRPGLRVYRRDPSTCWGWSSFDLKDVGAFQEKYDMGDSISVAFQLTLMIPMEAFCFTYGPANWSWTPVSAKSTTWSSDLFEAINEQSEFSNAKLVSRDDRCFYCHQVVLGSQSPVFAAMFRHSSLGGGRENGTYRFPAMNGDSLKAVLDYLYTGQVMSIKNLTTDGIFETADAAEQYGLPLLKGACRVNLWYRALAEPDSCYRIASFADLHPDMKRVKHRMFDYLAENFFALNLNEATLLHQKFGGDRRAAGLVKEFNEFMAQRAHRSFSSELTFSYSYDYDMVVEW